METSSTYLYTLTELLALNIPTTVIKKNIIKTNCSNSIGNDYIENLTTTMIHNKSSFDLVVITNIELQTYKRTIKYDTLFQGFAIVQKGECNKYADAFCLNLICSSSQKGKLLLVLYLYIIKTDLTIKDKFGLLELANGYVNGAGYCLYSKCGFVYNTDLHDNCFIHYNNMPMICDLTNTSPNHLINIIAYKTTILPVPLPKEYNILCTPQPSKAQLCIGICLNLLSYINLKTDRLVTNYSIDEYAIEYEMSNGNVIYYDKLYALYNNDDTDAIAGLNELIYLFQQTPPVAVDDFLSKYYIEAVPEIVPIPIQQMATTRTRRQISIKNEKDPPLKKQKVSSSSLPLSTSTKQVRRSIKPYRKSSVTKKRGVTKKSVVTKKRGGVTHNY